MPFSVYRSAKPGDLFTFGVYPQASDGADRTPIRWRILQSPGSELFLLSEYILDCKRYHGEFADVTWRDCDLRKWLNDDFYNAAFNAAEKEMIQTTRCADNGEGSPDTQDKVFLLGVAEVKSLTDIHGKTTAHTERRATGTECARVKKADGCCLYVYDKSVSDDYLTKDDQKQGCSWWWLRTQLGDSSRASFVGPRASVRSYCRVNHVSYGVRPALKLDLRC